MSFGQPAWLLAGAILVGLLVALLRRSDARRATDLARFVAARLVPELTTSLSPQRRLTKRALLLGSIGLLCAALARPLAGVEWEESRRRGIDVLIAVDVSKSMLARDVVPDRLARAKLAIADLAEGLEGDRLGLIAFAGSAFLQCPLTLDRTAFLESLGALAPGIVETPGSDFASALTVAEEALRTEGRNVKLLVLFSDGEDLGGAAIEAAQRIAKAGVKVYTVGIGSPAGELVPLPQADGGTGFVRDERGEFVKSRLDEATLRGVAEATGGFYEPLGQRGEGVAALISRALRPIPKEELAARMRKVPIDRYRWPLATAIGLLAADMLLRERRRTTGRRAGGKSGGDAGAGARRSRGVAARRTLVALAVPTLLAGLAGNARASARSALSRFESGDYAGALEEYQALARRDESDARLDFNVGASAYKAGKFDEAAAAFARALRSRVPEQQAMAFYNLGNSQYRLGQQTLERDREGTRKSWQQALDAYEQALRLRPEDSDARYNRDLVAAALEQMQQQDEQKKQEEEQKKKDEDQQKQDQQQKDGDQQPPSGENGEPRPTAGGEPQSSPSPAPDDGPRPSPSPGEDGGAGRPTPQDGESPSPEASPSPGGDQGDGGPSPTPTAGEGAAAGASPGAQASPAPEGASGSEDGSEGEEAAAEDGSPPGQLGAKDAATLLDSLRGEERRVPIFGGSRGGRPSGSGTVRDW